MAVCSSRLLNFFILLLACTTVLVLCSNEETPEIEPKESPVNSTEVAAADVQTTATPPVKKKKRVSFSSAVKMANIPDKESQKYLPILQRKAMTFPPILILQGQVH
ncbi:hypothetical protein Tsp_11281 [Trichinella spiralis]|uniref:hypothetical protein n=1 Tax=Trichinella spiralis TaxID=6334 RepID=UPI0001EFED2B|nr:hypothetical protein Tsp_11281 [Trichinella spiralis]